MIRFVFLDMISVVIELSCKKDKNSIEACISPAIAQAAVKLLVIIVIIIVIMSMVSTGKLGCQAHRSNCRIFMHAKLIKAWISTLRLHKYKWYVDRWLRTWKNVLDYGYLFYSHILDAIHIRWWEMRGRNRKMLTSSVWHTRNCISIPSKSDYIIIIISSFLYYLGSLHIFVASLISLIWLWILTSLQQTNTAAVLFL